MSAMSAISRSKEFVIVNEKIYSLLNNIIENGVYYEMTFNTHVNKQAIAEYLGERGIRIKDFITAVHLYRREGIDTATGIILQFSSKLSLSGIGELDEEIFFDRLAEITSILGVIFIMEREGVFTVNTQYTFNDPRAINYSAASNPSARSGIPSAQSNVSNVASNPSRPMSQVNMPSAPSASSSSSVASTVPYYSSASSNPSNPSSSASSVASYPVSYPASVPGSAAAMSRRTVPSGVASAYNSSMPFLGSP